MKKLFHKDLGLPKVRYPMGEFRLEYSRHAIEASRSDRYGYIHLPEILDTMDCTIIEVGTEDDRVVKIVYRQSYDSNLDLVLVVNPLTWKVITVWVNEKADAHRTLNVRNYVMAEA